MDRSTLLTIGMNAYNATSGSGTQKLTAAIQTLIDTMRPGYLMVSTKRGTQFVMKAVNEEGTAPPGRPAYDDVLALAASMEQAILDNKGAALDTDNMTLNQLKQEARQTAADLTPLVNSGNVGAVLTTCIRLAILAGALQRALV